MKSTDNSLSTFGLVLLVAGQLLPQIDSSIVNVALDHIGHSLHTNDIGLILIVAVYGLSYAASIAIGGRLGERYGKKRLFLIGVIGFGFASIVCGFAYSLSSMLLGRLMQGLFGALLIPQILAIIHSSLCGERHSRAVGIYTSIGGLSFVLGQSLGGWLVSANLFDMGWRLTFFINIPVCIFVFFFGLRAIPESQTVETPQMDIDGIAIFTLLLSFILVPVSVGSNWPALWWLLIAVIPLGWTLYKLEVRKERLGQQPVFPPSLFKTPNFIVGASYLIGIAMTFPGYIFVTALTLQSKLDFTPLQSGNTFISMGLTFFFGSILSKRMSAKINNHRYYLIGIAFILVGFITTTSVMYWQGSHLQVWDLVIATGLVGFGNSCLVSSAFRTALENVKQRQASEASSVLNTVQQGCIPISAAIAGTIYTSSNGYGDVFAMSYALASLSVILLMVGAVSVKRVKTNKMRMDVA
ncbi:arabinose transporter permease [Photobacterium angustum]|uniref:MFS transporter n=1 Tax=Photobacterium angustum TaxID=661 RepID=A0ABX5H4V8_PHOAN|nr:MFS transporter [Photobacterium angustum]KJG36196.1 arabinose transporter permease [Photobacterium angustum]PSX10908.1 MFS transporter [Photobacterium angustum]